MSDRTTKQRQNCISVFVIANRNTQGQGAAVIVTAKPKATAAADNPITQKWIYFGVGAVALNFYACVSVFVSFCLTNFDGRRWRCDMFLGCVVDIALRVRSRSRETTWKRFAFFLSFSCRMRSNRLKYFDELNAYLAPSAAARV